MSIQAYINFNGDCREALEYYEKVFETERPKIMLYGDVPSNMGFPGSEEAKKLVLNSSIIIKGSEIMMSDVPPGMPLVTGNNITLVIMSQDKDDVKTMFDRIKADGTVKMDLQETFWSKLYGFVIDRFGIGWQFNYSGK